MRSPRGLRRALSSCAPALIALVAFLAGPVALASADSNTYKVAVNNSSPAGYYPLDGSSATSALDASGHPENNLSGPGGVGSGITTGQPGPFVGTKSYKFTGAGDGYLDRSGYTATNNFAIELWARSDQSSDWNTPVSNGIVTSCRYGGWPVVKDSGMYAYAAGGCNQTAGSATYNVFSGTTDWHYIVYTRTSGLASLWIDGVQQPSNNTMSVAYTTGHRFRIGGVLGGSSSATTGGPFKGSLSNVAFYGHALSGSDIGAHYAAAQDAPVNTTAPTTAPNSNLGPNVILRANPGSWTSINQTYTYQWQRCDGFGNQCANLPGATAAGYTITDDDTEMTLRVRVTATNAGGFNSAYSAVTPVIDAQTPRGQGSYANAVLNDYPTGYYPLDGTSATSAADASGHPENNLSGPGGGITTGQAGPFLGSKSYKFTGNANGYVDRSGYTATDNFAIELWARSDLAAEWNTPVSNGVVNTSCRYGSWPVVNGGGMYAYAAGGCNQTAGSATYSVFSGTSDWHYIVLTRTSGLSSLWIDGVQQSSNNTMSVAHSVDDRFRIGGVSGGIATNTTGGPFKGSLSNVAFYGHALSGASIAAHYDAAQGAPTAQIRPVISPSTGLMEDDQLTVSPGVWAGSGNVDTPSDYTYTYQWESCDGSACTPISGATSTTYTLTNADIGKAIRATVSATGTTGTTTGAGRIVTRKTAVVAPRPPVNTVPPAISGDTTDFQVLSSTAGTWTGSAPIAYTRQWQRCNTAGGACANIAGATAASYTLTSADVGKTIRVVVIATNAAAAVSATSAASAVVVGVPPTNTVLPAISGTARDTQTLSSSTGTWSGSTPRTYTRVWQRCDSAGANCAPIAGATGTSYVLTTADVGTRVRVVLTATNMAGTSSATSAATTAIVPSAPVNTVTPTISGTALDGQTLTTTDGTWKGTTPVAYSYRWQRCDPACADIAGATASSYTLTAADAGATVRAVVTATNVAGNASASSAQTATVAAIAPTNDATPVISGDVVDGQVVTATPGAWSGTAPITYTYAWQRCDADGTGCVGISGAADDTYTLTSADAGNTVRVVVTAHNLGHSVEASSATTVPVAAVAPSSDPDVAPAISGDPTDGETLTASHGSWSGTTPMTYTYTWQRCDADGTGCEDIAGALEDTYTLTSDDTGHVVRVTVTAVNAAGSSTASSVVTDPIAAVAPTKDDAPAISGNLIDGETLTASHGTWHGTTPMAYTYQWQRCDADGTGCEDIADETSDTYTLTTDDVGLTIRVAVTATNSAGDDTAHSFVTEAVAAG